MEARAVRRLAGRRTRIRLTAAILTVSAAGAAAPTPASALLPSDARARQYDLEAQALVGGETGDVYLAISARSSLPESLRHVQLKLFDADGDHLRTVNRFVVPAPGGRALLRVAHMRRGQLIAVKATFHADRAYVVRATAIVRERPDLAVAEMRVPTRVVRRQPAAVEVTVAERAGDTGARAEVALFDGLQELAETTLAVHAGGETTASFEVRLADLGSHTLRAVARAAEPAEWNLADNSAERALEVARYDVDGAVTSQHPLATETGLRILEAGGNAFDAAIAMQFVLAVVQPHANGIGGGATVLAHTPGDGTWAIDARETAPAAATPTQFVGLNAAQRETSGLAVGVPGTLRALEYLSERWGTMPWPALVADAIRLAEDGFAVGRLLALASGENRTAFQPETAAVFRRPDGTALAQGDLLRQPDLARTLRILAGQGADAFYGGAIADALLEAQLRTRITGANAPAGRGRMTQADLDAYAVDVRRPARIAYRDFEVASAPPSSSGGLSVLQALQMLERFPLGDSAAGLSYQSTTALHLQIEALRLALADALFWVGDLDPYAAPVSCLLAPDYAEARSALISPTARIAAATAGQPCTSELAGTEAGDPGGGANTTHFGVADRFGNVVSFTGTITDGWGTGITVPGYGFLLNNSLSNFNATPARSPTNPGANDVGPGKRAKGNTAPTLVFDADGNWVLATGSPGAVQIPSVVLSVLLGILDYGLSPEQAVADARLWVNSPTGGTGWNAGLPAESVAGLRALGHPLNAAPAVPTAFGSVETLHVDAETFALTPVADPRSAPDATSGVLPP